MNTDNLNKPEPTAEDGKTYRVTYTIDELQLLIAPYVKPKYQEKFKSELVAYTTNKIIEARIDQMNSWFIEADDGGVILRAYLPPTEKRMRLEGQFVTAYYYAMELLKEALNHRKDD